MMNQEDEIKTFSKNPIQISKLFAVSRSCLNGHGLRGGVLTFCDYSYFMLKSVTSGGGQKLFQLRDVIYSFTTEMITFFDQMVCLHLINVFYIFNF